MLRDDQRDPLLSGNKSRKLGPNLIAAQQQGIRTLVSMGGPYSNHLHALAAAGRQFGFRTIGYLRGEPGAALTPTLTDCQAAGMELRPVARERFRQLRADPALAHEGVAEPVLWLPEGGSNALAVAGVAEAMHQPALAAFAPDVVLTAAGTGATAAGLAVGLAQIQAHGEIWAVAVLKGGGFLLPAAKALLTAADLRSRRPLRVLTGFHFGGYGRRPPALLKFCAEFQTETGLPVEPIYTGRVCYALTQLARAGAFRRGSRVLLVHTGGLQGARHLSPAEA